MLGKHQASETTGCPGARIYTARDRAIRRLMAGVCSLGCLGVLGFAFVRMIRGSANLSSGDFKHFFWAAEAMRDGLDPYAAGVGGYIYPPLYAWLIQPLIAMGRIPAERVWGVINMGLIVVCLLVAFRIVSERLRGHRDALTLSAVCFMALGLTFEPVRWEMEEGQTDTVVLLSLTLGLLLLDRVPWLAGAALALALQVKHQAVLFLVYLLARGRFAAAGGMILVTPLLALLPMITLGPERWAGAMGRAYGYVSTLATGGDSPEGVNLHPITWDLSVSVPSAIARALEHEGEVPTAMLAGIVGGLAGIVFALSWWLFASRGQPLFRGRFGRGEVGRPGTALIEWCGLIVAILVFSPQTMVRHSFVLLPVHVLVAYLLLVPKPGLNRWPLIVGTVIYQLGTRLPPGQEGFEEALASWRSVSGASWCMLCMWFGLIWTGLGAAREAYPVQRDAEPAR